MMLRYLIILFLLMLFLAVFVVRPVKAEDTAILIDGRTGEQVEVDPEFAATALSVIECESHDNPEAVNRTSGATGLLQIMQLHTRRINAMGFAWSDMKQWGPNILVAEALWSEQGWRPWSCQPKERNDGYD